MLTAADLIVPEQVPTEQSRGDGGEAEPGYVRCEGNTAPADGHKLCVLEAEGKSKSAW